MSPARINHKRGDTLVFAAQLLGEDGAPAANFDAYSIRMQFRDAHKNVVASLEIGNGITIENVGEARYSGIVGADVTADWAIGPVRADIEYNVAGIVSSSETILIVVEEDVTR